MNEDHESHQSHEADEPDGPVSELGANGTASNRAYSTEENLKSALSALAARQQRDPVTKRFVVGSTAAGKTLERSAHFWQAVEPAKRELVDRVCADLAVNVDTAETMLGLIDGYAEARLFRMSMFLRLVDQGGPITNKGKARALYRAYLHALDHETKLAQILGLERKSKPVSPLDAIREAVSAANEP